MFSGLDRQYTDSAQHCIGAGLHRDLSNECDIVSPGSQEAFAKRAPHL